MRSASAASGRSISTGCAIPEPASTSSSRRATRPATGSHSRYFSDWRARFPGRRAATEKAVPALVAVDEAGNIPLHNLSEALGVGRGRRCGIVLGYQNIGQLYKQHGRDGAQGILGSIGTMVFLPGLDSETAQYAARRIGRTTVLQLTSVNATG